MKRILWILAAIAVSTGVYFTIRYGLRPKAIPVLNATQFSGLEEIGGVLYKRLRNDIRTERVIVLGSFSKEDDPIWKGLIQAAQADGERTIEFLERDTEGDALLKVKESLKAGQLVIVEGSTSDVSHLVEGSLSKRLEKVVGTPVLSISTLGLVISTEDYEGIQSRCLDATEQKSGMVKLECAAQKVARKNLKKKLAPERIWAVMERHGLKEYLLFVHRPTSPVNGN